MCLGLKRGETDPFLTAFLLGRKDAERNGSIPENGSGMGICTFLHDGIRWFPFLPQKEAHVLMPAVTLCHKSESIRRPAKDDATQAKGTPTCLSKNLERKCIIAKKSPRRRRISLQSDSSFPESCKGRSQMPETPHATRLYNCLDGNIVSSARRPSMATSISLVAKPTVV